MTSIDPCRDLQMSIALHHDPYELLAFLLAWRERGDIHEDFAASLLAYVHAAMKESEKALRDAERALYGSFETSPAELIPEG